MNNVDGEWRGEKWWVSPFNFSHEVRKTLTPPDNVVIHDVTLRDGEQTPGIVLRSNEKIEIAKALDEAGVGRIEAGMPVVSKEDFEAVKTIANEGLNAKVFAFSRLVKDDINAAIDTGVSGIIVEGPVGVPKLMQFGWREDEVLEKALSAVEYAKDHGLYTVFFGVDGTRAELNFLKKIYSTVARDAHADAVAVVDTFGCSPPEGFRYLVSEIKKVVNVPVEVHCHNDFGLGVACSIAGVMAGAEVVHVSVNGIGERAGNAALEEVSLSLELLYGVRTGIRYEKLVRLSKLVEELTGFRLQPNKPVVGSRVFTRESGISVAGWMKYHLGSEAYLPELVGNVHDVVIGKKSGKHSIEWKLKKMGIEFKEEDIPKIVEKVKQLSIQKKAPIDDEELLKILKEVRQE